MFGFSLLSSNIGQTEDGYLYKEVWTEYAQNLFNSVFLYTAVALAAILVCIGVLVYFKKRESIKGYVKGAACVALGFAATVILTMFALSFAEISEKGYAEYSDILGFVLVPSAVLGGVAVLGIIAAYIASLFSKKIFKITLISALSAFGAAFIAFFVCLAVYFARGSAEENNGATITVGENVGLYLCALGIIALIAVLAFVFGRGEKREFDSKTIAYAAICIAASFALSYIRIVHLPQGGSVTLVSLLPLMLFSYMFGVRKGVCAGIVYGLLQAMQDPFLIHPAQFLLDYPVAFAAIGISGMFAKFKNLQKLPQVKFALGGVVAAVIRFISHVLSGVFAFSEYSTLDNVWAYSMAYNSFVFVDIAICIAVGAVALSVKSFAKQIEIIRAANLNKPAADEDTRIEPQKEAGSN